MTRRIVTALLLAVSMTCAARAQDKEAPAGPQNLYHLKLVVKELDGGKVINAREYETNLTTVQGKPATYVSSIRTGNKVPIATGTTAASNTVNTMYTYVDVGVNFDIRDYRVEGEKASFVLKAEISNAEAMANGTSQPIIHQNMWTSAVWVTLKKPTVVYSSDDVSTKRTTQVEVTAVEVK